MDPMLSLRLDVDELTQPHLETYEAKYSVDGQAMNETVRHQVPGLIDQLRQSQAEGLTGGTSQAFGSKPPINLHAFQTYATIASDAAAQYTRLTGKTCHPTIEKNIQGWAAHAQQTTEELDHCLDNLDTWINQIQELFTPQRRWDLTRPCPACDTRTVHYQQDGETRRRSALTITTDPPVAECGSCGAQWDHTQWELLATILEQETA